MSAERIWELIARKLSGEASSEELQELDQLLRTHPDLHIAVQTISDLWLSGPEAAGKAELEVAYDKHIDRMQQQGININQQLPEHPDSQSFLIEGAHPKSRRTYLWWTVAASTLIIGTLLIFILSKNGSELAVKHIPAEVITPSEVTTKYGSRTKIKLPDGTQVYLNAGSKLSYDKEYDNQLREVVLTGEAFFDVVRNVKKPFIIHTNTVNIKVLGTQFNVKSYPTDKTTETSLIHGSVEVMVKKRPNEKYILKPNEKLVVLNDEEADSVNIFINGKGTPVKIHPVSKEPLIAIKKLTYQTGDTSAIESAWTKNKLSFKDEPFGELAKKMERWYDVEFEFKNAKLENLFITGSFDSETLVQALEALRYSFKFNYKINYKKVTIF